VSAPRVSVIVPCRNAARTLPATLAAVAAQNLRPAG
jgi:glycosyltransferase involved in cell wall biosynthesis